MKNLKELINATTTPLASIFGSGFLVMIPILASTVGSYAVVAMFFITLLAYSVGSVVRYNIRYAEPILETNSNKITSFFEKLSDISLVLAYIVSISLYLNILSAFVMKGLQNSSPFNENMLTTTIIIFITVMGITKGLKSLEILEKYALWITIIIVVFLVIAFALYDYNTYIKFQTFTMPKMPHRSTWEVVSILAGMLIVVQGFETSRYLGESYSKDVRIITSKYSQIISSVVYLVLIFFALPITDMLNGTCSENSLISLVKTAAPILVIPLIVVAALSQFSASVADTLAAIGDMYELFNKKLSQHFAYFFVGVGAVFITWSVNTLEILAFASRAFALYYLLQTMVAISIAKNMIQKLFMSLLVLILVFIIIFASPVG